MPIDQLTGFYDSLIEDVVESAKKRKFVSLEGVVDEERQLARDAEFLGPKGGFEEVKFHNARNKHFFEMIYDLILDINSVEEGTYTKIAEKLQYKLLTDADVLLDMLGGVKNATKDDFVAQLNPAPNQHGVHLASCVKAVALLKLVSDDKSLISRLGQYSVVAPNSLFRKRIPLEEIEYAIACEIPNFVSERLIGLFPAINEVIVPAREATFANPINPDMGKYRLPTQIAYKWRSNDEVDFLDNLFSDPDVRREVYETIMSCADLTYDQVTQGRRSVKSGVFSKSGFRLSRPEYAVLMQAVERYAINQLAGSYRNGKSVNETRLSRRMNLKPVVAEDELHIEEYSSKQRLQSVLILKKDGLLQNSSFGLPLALYIISRNYAYAQNVLNRGCCSN